MQVLQTPDSPCRKAQSTLLPVCNNGCPATISINLCNPSLRCSITSSVNLFVKICYQLSPRPKRELELTFPGRGGILTLVLSLSRISLKASKSEYRRLTTEWRNLNAGIFVYLSVYRLRGHVRGRRDIPYRQSRSLCTFSSRLHGSLDS
jgi:hypothetical protein